MTNPEDGEFDPPHPDEPLVDDTGLGDHSLHDEHPPGHDAPYDEGLPRARKAGSGLPWLLTVLLACGLLGGGIVSHQKVTAANNAAELAETRYDELHGRATKMDEDRKNAVAQASDLTARYEDANAKVGSLTKDLKERDAALAQAREAQSTLIARLKAAVKASPKGKLAHQVLAALPKANAPDAAPRSPTGVTKTRRNKRGTHTSNFP